ncbi:MAG: ABC transporter permease subunit [Caldilineaceae bacterium]|nr:ABC transporter permease subunit [Caldilineaceae bacterium]
MSARNLSRDVTSFYRDTRFLAIIAQILFALVMVLIFAFFIRNMLVGLRASNIPIGWGFLSQEAGFAIAEGPAFSPSDTYLRAYLVGVANTIRVAASGVVLATLVGLLVGISRLSTNWLLRTLAGGYIDLIRNTPLLVQLFFWYFAVILKLPDVRASIEIPGIGFLSNRGTALTWVYFSEVGRGWVGWLLAALIIAIVIGVIRRRQLNAQGLVGTTVTWTLPAFLIVAAIGYFLVDASASLPSNVAYDLRRGDRGTLFVDVNGNGRFDAAVDRPLARVPVTLLDADGVELGTVDTDTQGEFRFFELEGEGVELQWDVPPPLVVSRPVIQGFNFRGGQSVSPEFFALLLGLVIYTGAFIAEIVRAGINAVPKGQWEASRALGLTGSQTMRMIVLPQALRVIIPPLTSQYLNLTKNSSLAIAVGYPDLFNVSRTIFNQSGAAIQVFIMIMATYLSISLLTSFFMNWYNKRVALVER